MKAYWSFLLCVAALLTVGCGEPAATTTAKQDKPAVPLPPPPPSPPGEEQDDAKAIKPGDDVEKAQVGVGAKGRGYGGGVITEPIRARFRAEDSINFANMQNTLKIFQAEKGRLPKTHEEFMTEIIEKGGIKLPELPPGDEYIYDPKAGELMVRHNQE